MKPTVHILASLLCLISAACIKEDRSKCPCYLEIDMSRVDSHYVHSVDLMMSDTYGRKTEWVPVDKEKIGDTLVLPVCKSEIDFCAWGNLTHSLINEEGHTIDSGNGRDSLWSYYEHIVAKGENATVTVMPLRQYIPMSIIVRGMLGGISNLRPELEGVSDRLSFVGNAAGDAIRLLPDLVSAPGESSSYYLYKTLLLTQESATGAILNLSYDRGGSTHLNSFPIGKMLLENGADLSMKGQNPVIVDLTIGSASVFIITRVEDWATHAVYEIAY